MFFVSSEMPEVLGIRQGIVVIGDFRRSSAKRRLEEMQKKILGNMRPNFEKASELTEE